MTRRSLLTTLTAPALLLALACAPATSGKRSEELAEVGVHPALGKGTPNFDLISREVLFGNPDKAAPDLSPDGTQLLYLAPSEDGVLNVWLGPSDSPDQIRPVTKDRKRGIRNAGWSRDGKWVFYIQDEAGDENWHLHRVNPKTHEVVDLTPYPGARAQIIGASDKHPGRLLIGLNDRDPKYFDVYSVDIASGERTLVEQNDVGYAGYVVDQDLKLRYAYEPQPDGGVAVKQVDPSANTKGARQWIDESSIPRTDAMSTGDVGFDRSGRYRYLLDSRGRETAALVREDTQTHARELLFGDPKANVSKILRNAETLEPMAVSVNWDKPRWELLDPSVAADFEFLATVDSGSLAIIDQTRDDSEWLVAFYDDAGPVRYYHYDREAKEAALMFVNREDLDGLELASMHPRVIDSRDGLELVSYLSLPPKADPDADGLPDAPVPMVLLVHGGPWGRDSWGYNPYHQWLTNRGYAVLSVNFRGSTGFGKSFTNAGDMQWAAKMHDDLLDAVDWAVDAGITSEDQVAIMGGSYGGYATLVGLTFTPDVFACGVDIVGPSNLVTLLETIPPYWAPMLAQFTTRVGDHRTEEGRELLLSRSPLTKVDAIQRPLLIGQGANDPRVKQSEADQIVAAMQAKDIPVTYVLFSDEGHGFARPENNQAFNAVTESFLAGCLGGEYMPYGDFAGSSIEVPVGAGYVPGLADAMNDAGR